MATLKDDIKDFGNWNVPTSWNEVTLKQFSEIEKFYENKDKDFNVREVLQIFCNKTEDEVNELPIEFTEKILKCLAFINEEKLDWGEPKNYIDIDNERYTIHFENQLKTGEYIMVDSIIKSDPHNYASILAVLCRKEGEIYDSKFENEILPSRVEMFERMPVTKLTGLVAFFFDLSLLYMNNSQLFTQAEAVLNHIRKHYETSIRNGRWWELCTLLQTKKLLRLLKSIKSTS